MIDAWIVVLEEKHIGDKFWVCLRREDALKIAEDVTAYWKKECRVKGRNIDVDTTCYEDLIFHYSAEDAFRVYVQPQQIREEGENKEAEP